jgi:ubiquinone/menaquinone biosynthesis C-methylase UbiE
MNDWRAYDTVAEAYERVAAARFATVARHLLALARPPEGAQVLDLGTGTGAVGIALADSLKVGRLVGCDLSLPMLTRARHGVPVLSPVLANAARLPFRKNSFDLVTANCVLSHLRDYRGMLHEILRVLAKPGSFAASCWGPASDPYGEVWSNLIEGTVGAGTGQRATEAVLPWESHFSSSDSLRTALLEAGFGDVHLDVFFLTSELSLEDYVSDRALGAVGRLGRRTLGESRWQEFLRQAEIELRRRFGDRVHFSRQVVLGVGTVA